MCRLSVGARAACLRGFEAFEAFFGAVRKDERYKRARRMDARNKSETQKSATTVSRTHA